MSFRGQAAFTWTDTDDQTTSRVLLLPEPLRELRPAHAQSVYVADSLDFQTRQTFTVGEGVDELVGHLRYQDDSQGLLDLLKAGSKQRTITYYPDLRDADVNYTCLLIDPLSPVAVGLDVDRGVSFAEKEITIRLRRTAKTAFTDAWKNTTLFQLRAGGRIEEGTFTRAGVASYPAIAGGGGFGTMTTAASGAARVGWGSTASSMGPRTYPFLLLESSRPNRVKDNRNLNTTNWAWNGAGTLTTGQADPWGGTNATLLNDASTTITVERRQTIILAAATRAAISVILKAHSTVATGSFRLMTTNAATTHIRGTITWSSGKMTAVAAVGTLVTIPERWRGDYYRVAFRSTGTLTTGNRFISLRPASTAVGSKGGLLVSGVQVEQ